MKNRPIVEITPEILEYKLEYTPDLRCEKQTDLVPICHSCKSCILKWKMFSTREWFLRVSQASQRQFLVGIIKRFRSQDLLNYAWNLLQSTNTKDFTYSRSCVSSSFTAASISNRGLDPQQLEHSMVNLWRWFLNASFWTKSNYILLLLQMCDAQLLLMAASLICSLLSKGKITTERHSRLGQLYSVCCKDAEGECKLCSSHHIPFAGFCVLATDNLHAPWLLSRESDQLFGIPLEDVDHPSQYSVVLNVSPPVPGPSQKTVSVNKFRDFIRCLPIYLSKRILRMLDSKSLTRCAYVSLHWLFLVKQIRKDILAGHSLRSEIAFMQGSCPKGAISNYAKIVKVAVPQINKDGDIIPIKGKNKLLPKESELMQKAYHGQETDIVKLEERNIFCSSYNVRVLVDSVDPNRVVHYSGGKLLAFGSTDRKIHFLNVNDLKPVPPLLYGHAGSIRAVYLNEPKGFLLSGSYDLSIRMWNIFTGTCVRIFNGHSGSITCLDVYKNKFVSGSKDCTAKMWSIETGKCLKTFGHKGIVWSAKMNDTHLVSACDRGIVKVWHAVTWILIKILQGHQGPVKCLSFDEWHLVTGSSDGYILGWSMLGKHKRCLVAFRHPMEVLHLGFLYLRVISGCADGKIRIFNFLTGTCLRVMRANSRGDPIMSFCIVENKLLINAQGSVVLFMFEEVKWDHSQAAEQVIKKQDRSKGDVLPIQMKPPPQLHTERQKRAKKTNWKLYSRDSNDVMLSYSITRRSARCSRDSPDLLYEMVKAPPPRKRNNVRSLDVSPDEKHRLSLLAKRYDLEDPQSITTLKGYSDDESDTEPPAPVSFCENAEAFIQYIRKRRPVHSISNDQMLLTIGTVQHVYKNDQVSANMAYNMKIKDAWGPAPPQKDQRKIIPAPPSPEQQKIDPPLQLKELMASGGSLGIERISTPYETRTLQVNLKNSLLGSSVKSSIPAPTITRSKSCSSLSGVKNAYTGHAKIPSPPGTGVQLIGHFTGSSESIKMPRMKIAQPGIGARSQPPKLFFTHTPNPLRQNTGFRLLTTQQMKQYAEEKISEYQANQTKVITNRKKECKNAWLRKIQGLPIDDFTKEGKISAPELGENVFI
ncbi:CMT1A duplicated region transcript 1 protein [Varanus komodoensis]|uniref:CMT1A duplicated region transcript 1 protein n=1 Tax=Varanus komodoensis TaxID=61221 RepID=UPI001CF7958B|nr:CMT1A duplicated region transcript 1 protein [Varanus komodoensis]